jgi:hypothetical protein
LKSNGDFVAYKMSDLFATGSLLPGEAPAQVLGFTTFRLPTSTGAAGAAKTPGASRGEH